MIYNYWFWYYIVVINIVSGILFATDKYAAIKNHQRIPEKTLHIFEILGGVFVNILLMYTLHHKNKKFKYWGWTWITGIIWSINIIIIIVRAFI